MEINNDGIVYQPDPVNQILTLISTHETNSFQLICLDPANKEVCK